MSRSVSFFRNLRFKYKLIFSYIVVSLIPLLAFGFYSFEQAQQGLLRQAEITLNDNTQKAAEDINNKFNKYNTIIDSISFNSKVADIFNTPYTSLFVLYQQLTETLDPLAYDLKTYNSDILDIFVYTSNNLPERSHSIADFDRLSHKPWLPEVMEHGQTKWILENNRLWGFKRIIIRANNKVNNVLAVEIDRQAVFFVPEQGESRKYAVLVTDQQYNSVYVKNGLGISDAAFAQEELDNGNKYLAIHKEIPEAGWMLSYYYPLDSLTLPTGNILGAVVAVAGISLLILLLLIWVFSNTLVRRIEYLNKKIGQIARGDLQPVMLNDTSKDEIGGLARGIGQMLDSINRLIHEVRESTEIQKEAQMRALQAQINPHLLYNSLSLINWKAIKMKAADISLITTSLSKFYRTTFNKGSSTTSVREEIDNIRAYLDIQLIIHDYAFDAAIEIEDEVLSLTVVNLILQPIVENAIEHGIDHKTDGRGQLKITGRLADNTVCLTVADNGPGMTPAQIAALFKEDAEGYGLKNVQKRMQLGYGDEYGIAVSSEPDKGTSVVFRFPAHPSARRAST